MAHLSTASLFFANLGTGELVITDALLDAHLLALQAAGEIGADLPGCTLKTIRTALAADLRTTMRVLDKHKAQVKDATMAWLDPDSEECEARLMRKKGSLPWAADGGLLQGCKLMSPVSRTAPPPARSVPLTATFFGISGCCYFVRFGRRWGTTIRMES